MPKSLEKRCIRAWRLTLRKHADSRVNPHWRGVNLRQFCRENGLITAMAMAERRAEQMAHLAWRNETGLNGWSPEFGSWFDEHRQGFLTEARLELESNNDPCEIDDSIMDEMSYWGD